MTAHVPVIPRRVSDILDEYHAKADAAADAVAAWEQAQAAFGMAATVAGQFVRPMVDDRVSADANAVRRNLLESGWRALYAEMQIDRLASANDKRRFEALFAKPPPLTIVSLRERFGAFILDPRQNILRGLAEVFCGLDPAYKSHSNVKFGVDRLPKRAILHAMRGYSSYGQDRLRAILNALAAYRGDPLVEYGEFRGIEGLTSIFGNKAGEVIIRGLTVRVFKNGNGHVLFDARAMDDINKALAEFYGDVLPDTPDAPEAKQPGTAVAKDLQFYPTPKSVIETILDEIGIYAPREWSRDEFKPLRVLEPSCGDGRIMDEIRRRGHKAIGYEVHPGRAAEARDRGNAVVTGNFLDQPPAPVFDRVVMNPPFYGRHYVKHVRHAMKFLKPGGRLVSVLPATAHYDHKELEGRWEDLPVASFAESGTNIPTGYLICGAAS